MSCNVLIIDDSMVDRNIVSKIIKKNMPEVTVFESADGRNILDLIVKHNIMTCVLDLIMPEKDGIELLSEIKSNLKTRNIPVIVCSGAIETDVLQRVLQLGAYDYFSKPLSKEAMNVSLPLKVRNAIELMKNTLDIVHLSKIDSLTGLFRREHFKKEIETISEEWDALPFSILMGDVNGLKIFNDAYGNHIGDRFLVKIADIIKHSCPAKSLVARWGGDEFAILLPNTNKLDAENYISLIKKEIGKLNHEGLNISMAFGSDTKSLQRHDISKVLINAEDAMFRDKILEDVSIRNSMLATVIHTLNAKNPREEAHSRRVSEYCEKMGKALNLGEKDVRDLKVIGLLHDIGKIAIDEHILNKPGRLTEEEWLQIKRHPEIGGRILSSSKEMTQYTEIILSHHEKFDGSGYPNGLKGNLIPYFSRVLTIIDSYDAMTCERTYKNAMSSQEAVSELIRCSDTQFDRELVSIFVNSVLCL